VKHKQLFYSSLNFIFVIQNVTIINMKKSPSILIWITLLIFGCSSEKPNKEFKIIDLENSIGKSKAVYLSEIAESIEYIPLETRKESIVGQILSDRLKLEDNLIVIEFAGNRNLKIFQRDGKFVDTLNKVGNGPDEVLTISDIDFSPGKKTISLYDTYKLIEFDIFGNKIRKIDVSKTKLYCEYLTGFTKLGDNYYVFPASNYDFHIKSEYSIFVLDTLSQIVLKTPYPKEEIEFVNSITGENSYSPEPKVFKFKNKVRVINGYNPYIVSINEDLTVDTAYVINYGKYNRKDFPDGHSSRNNIPCLEFYGKIFEGSSYLLMQFRTGTLPIKKREMLSRNGVKITHSLACSIFDKKSGEFSFIDPCDLNEFGIIDDIYGGPAFWPMYISKDDYMINIIDAYKFIQYAQTHKVTEKIKKIADSLNENDNPVVVLVKLKR